MDHSFNSPVILSLCTGMRGLERGLERAIGPIRTAAYVEIEAFICWNLVKKMEQGILAPVPIWTNLKTFPAQEFHGKIHGIIGGYPCQPFSVAGLGKGAEDPRHLWPFIAKHIEAIKPSWCFFENVANHLNLGYEIVRGELQGMGYAVEEGVYSAEEVGAPHRRERLFILAIKMEHAGDGNGWNVRGQKFSEQKFNEPRDSGNSVANTKSEGIGQLSEHQQRQEWNIEIKNSNPYRSGKKMANPDIKFRGQQQQFEGSDGARAWHESTGSSEAMADSNNERLQGWNSGELQKYARECTARTSSAFSGWPAPPQFPQYEWEQPRTESKMGFTINGYNFREDLLRMAGNGVVEQTAEFAYIDLLRKHGLIA